LARRVRHRVSVSSPGIVPRRRYSEIGFHQSTSGSGGPTTISPPGSWFGLIGPNGAPELTSKVRLGMSLPSGVPNVSTGLSSPGDIFLEPDGRIEQILREHTRRGRFTARLELGEGVGRLVVLSKNMLELKAIDLLLQLSNLLPVCSHTGVAIVQLSRNLIDDELRVSADVKPLNPKFGGDAQTVDQCLVLHPIVGGAEV
jgi:hypothetical protein